MEGAKNQTNPECYGQPITEARGHDSDIERPFLILKGCMTEDTRIRAYRWSALRMIGIILLIYVTAILVIHIGTNLYYGFPTFDLSGIFSSEFFWIMLAAMTLVYAVKLLWLRPRKLRKNLREMYGNTAPWETEYDFYEDHFTFKLIGTKNSRDINLNYTDLKKIKVYRYYILLQTKTKNRLSITRDELSWEDEQKLLGTLRERSAIE